jgi:hypothetical protein
VQQQVYSISQQMSQFRYLESNCYAGLGILITNFRKLGRAVDCCSWVKTTNCHCDNRNEAVEGLTLHFYYRAEVSIGLETSAYAYAALPCSGLEPTFPCMSDHISDLSLS